MGDREGCRRSVGVFDDRGSGSRVGGQRSDRDAVPVELQFGRGGRTGTKGDRLRGGGIKSTDIGHAHGTIVDGQSAGVGIVASEHNRADTVLGDAGTARQNTVDRAGGTRACGDARGGIADGQGVIADTGVTVESEALDAVAGIQRGGGIGRTRRTEGDVASRIDHLVRINRAAEIRIPVGVVGYATRKRAPAAILATFPEGGGRSHRVTTKGQNESRGRRARQIGRRVAAEIARGRQRELRASRREPGARSGQKGHGLTATGHAAEPGDIQINAARTNADFLPATQGDGVGGAADFHVQVAGRSRGSHGQHIGGDGRAVNGQRIGGAIHQTQRSAGGGRAVAAGNDQRVYTGGADRVVAADLKSGISGRPRSSHHARHGSHSGGDGDGITASILGGYSTAVGVRQRKRAGTNIRQALCAGGAGICRDQGIDQHITRTA